MGLNNIEYDDFIRVEESQVNRWRVFDGANWAHGFDYKQEAIDFAERVGGTRVAYCKLIDDKVHYLNAQKVRTECSGCDGTGKALMVVTYVRNNKPDEPFERKEYHTCKTCNGLGLMDMKDKVIQDAEIEGRLKALREKNFETLPYE